MGQIKEHVVNVLQSRLHYWIIAGEWTFKSKNKSLRSVPLRCVTKWKFLPYFLALSEYLIKDQKASPNLFLKRLHGSCIH